MRDDKEKRDRETNQRECKKKVEMLRRVNEKKEYKKRKKCVNV